MRPRQALDRVVTFPARRPIFTLLAAAIVTILATISVLRLRADASLEAMLAHDDPAGAALVHVLKDFAAVDDLLVLASLPDREAKPDVDRLVNFASRLEESINKSPATSAMVSQIVYRADTETRKFFEKVLVPAGLFYLDDASYKAARHRLTTEEIREQIRKNESMISVPGPAAGAMSKVILQDPLRLHEFILARLVGQKPFKTFGDTDAFVSPDGRSILIRITGKRPPSDLEFSAEFSDAIAAATKAMNADGLSVEISGAYAIAATSQRSIRRDMIESVTGSVVGLLVLFIVAYRKPNRTFLLAFGPIALGILWGFGAYAIISPTLTPMTAVLGAVLAGMGIDYSIQVLSQYQDRRAGGMPAREAAMDTSRNLILVKLAAWLTSVVGFIAIGSSSVSALRDFSVMGSLGLTGAFIASATVLPALLVLTDRSAADDSRWRFSPRGLVAWIANHPRVSFGGTLVLLAICVAVIVRGREILPLESDLTVMHPRPNPALEAQKLIAEKFGTSPGSLIVFLKANSSDDLVKLSHRVEERLRSDKAKSAGVVTVLGLSMLLPDPDVAIARQKDISNEYADRVVADFKSAVAESIFEPAKYEPYAGFLKVLLTNKNPPKIADLIPYRMLATTMLPRSAFAGDVNPKEAITLVFMSDPLDRREKRQAAITAIRSSLDGLQGATLTGLSVLGDDSERTVQRDMPRLILIAIGIVIAYLILHFRNFVDAILACLPTVFGLVVLLAVAELVGEKLNMINLIAIPLLIGVDVDYGIFLVSLFRQKNLHASEIDRLTPAVHAILLCAAATMLGFGALVTTSVPAVKSLGVAVAVGVGACFFASLFLLVPILLKLRKNS